MPYIVSTQQAQAIFKEYTFIAALTPSEQKAAFHIQDKSGRDLCLKMISPSFDRERIDREIMALQSLSHPNVVRLIEYTYSAQSGRQRHFSIEEFIDGDDLSTYLDSGRPWQLKDVLTVFIPLCDGLQAIHSQGIVHRDLKPSNVRIRRNGSPVIIDFGIARHLTLPAITSTSDGARLGTPLYFAPEQFTGTKHDIDQRTDLFSLGIILYQALIGHHPFFEEGMTTIDELQDVVCNSTDYLANETFVALSPNLRSIVSRLLEKERARRPQSAELVAKLLRKVKV